MTTYYISTVDPNASDANSGTTQALPWLTLQKLNIEFLAGTIFTTDTILIENGTDYIVTLKHSDPGIDNRIVPQNVQGGGGIMTFSNYGTGPDFPIIRGPAASGGEVGALFYIPSGVSNPPADILIQNIDMRDTDRFAVISVSTGQMEVTVQNCEIGPSTSESTQNTGVGIFGSVGEGKLIVRDCHIHGVGEGVYITNGMEAEIRDNLIEECRDEAIDPKSDAGPCHIHHNEIRDTSTASHRTAAINVNGNGHLIEHNTIKNVNPASLNKEALGMWIIATATNCTIRKNLIDGVNGDQSATVAAIRDNGGVNCLVENNTLRNARYGVYRYDAQGTVTYLSNIIADTTIGLFCGFSGVLPLLSDYNIYHNNMDDFWVSFNQLIPYMNSQGHEQNTLLVDPLFTGINSSIEENSQAIGNAAPASFSDTIGWAEFIDIVPPPPAPTPPADPIPLRFSVEATCPYPIRCVVNGSTYPARATITDLT